MSSDLQNEFTKAWDAVQKINQFLYYGIFDQTTGHSSNSFSMIWANRSLHEFLLAYYFANYATSEESRYLWDWIYLPDRTETDQYYPFWQFLCEMPPAHCNAAVWLRSIEVLYWPTIPRANALPSKYSLTSDYPFYAKRSNEMIYRSWEQLGFYANDKDDPEMKAQAHTIRERWWGEFEGVFLKGEYGSELQATAKEITEHLLLIPAGKVTLGTSPERQEIPRYLAAGKQKLDEFRDEAKVEEYFAEYPFYQTRAGKIEKERLKQKLKAILKEDTTEEAIFEFLEAFFGVTFVSNPELAVDAFKLGRQTISNTWYRLYNPRHTQIKSYYKEYSETRAHPAVEISFFDAWVYSKWLRWDGQSCRLPWETEWEYAAKYGFPSWQLEYWWEGIEHLENPDRAFTKSRINCDETTDKKPSNQDWGCTVIPDPSRASPGSRELDGGPMGQNKGLMDMQGNTWEWCQDKQRSNYLDKAKTTEFPVQEQQHREDSLACDASVSRVLRGGSFDNYGRSASASFRLLYGPADTHILNGFRVARAREGKP
jgi:formylglycine-generating enzyme required for sulfatase activity